MFTTAVNTVNTLMVCTVLYVCEPYRFDYVYSLYVRETLSTVFEVYTCE